MGFITFCDRIGKMGSECFEDLGNPVNRKDLFQIKMMKFVHMNLYINFTTLYIKISLISIYLIGFCFNISNIFRKNVIYFIFISALRSLYYYYYYYYYYYFIFINRQHKHNEILISSQKIDKIKKMI
jgi:hypothetical protein